MGIVAGMTTPGNIVLWSGDEVGAGEWKANAAAGSSARISVETGATVAALRFDFELAGHGSWVIARRELAAALPAHYAGVLRLRGAIDSGASGTEPAPVELQLKLVDPSGANVWWWRRKGFVPPAAVERIVLRRAALEFAWGPASGGEPERVAAVELALACDGTAAGTLWIEALAVEARDPAAAHPGVAALRVSSTAAGLDASRPLATTGGKTAWRPAAGDSEPWLELDFGRSSEWGGVVVDFAEQATPCRLLASDDGEHWEALAQAPASGRRVWLRTAGSEGRFARVAFAAGSVPAVVRADVVPIERAISPARYAAAAAARAPRGRFPRHLLGEQAYWALAGGDGDERKGLLSEEGALEVDAESFTLEPFLWVDGALITWADVEASLSLAGGHLPLPTVEWRAVGLSLRITAFAIGEPGASALVARYEIANEGGAANAVRLFVAIRPFQVNPSWQSLNLTGGIAPITRLACDGTTVEVNAARRVIAVTRPDAAGAAASEEGIDALAAGEAPGAADVDDPLGFATAAFAFDLRLAAGGAETVALAVPLFDTTPALPAGLDRDAARAWVDGRHAEAVAHWRRRLGAVPIELPACATPMADTLRASLGWILVNREGPRIQPGSRCYRRAWIRDGTLTGTAMAEMGFAEEAREFLRWYAPYQFPDGRVPCAVDRRGVDHAVEHDSHGQLIWGTVELYRLTGDHVFLAELWPHLLRAVEALAALRAERTTERYSGDARFGLLPESISHEGYASNPVHSYWDDFFAVRGLADAAEAAEVLGDGAAAERIGRLAAAMRDDLYASIARTIADHKIDFLPGSVELGDFDPTSSAISLDPCGLSDGLPPAALKRTFDRYWEELEARRRGEMQNEAYTPYEVRTAAAFVFLGEKERARSLLDWLIRDQRPTAWRQWPEVAWRKRRAPRFIGDLPHGWVASSFVRAVRRLIAYERPSDAALVLAAGVPEAWVREAPGVRASGLPTHFGPLDYTMLADGEDRVRVSLSGSHRPPPGGVVIVSPLARPLRAARVDGREESAADPRQFVLMAPASEVVLIYA